MEEERVTKWMLMCLGAVKEWLDKIEVGEQLRWALGHALSNEAGGCLSLPGIMCWLIESRRCYASHTQRMWRGTQREWGWSPRGDPPMHRWMRSGERRAATSTGRMSISGKWEVC